MRDETPWSDGESAFLMRHYKRPGWSAARIANRLKRSRNEVIGKARRLGLANPMHHVELKERTYLRRCQVAVLRQQGMTARTIAQNLGATLKAIEGDCHKIRHGLLGGAA